MENTDWESVLQFVSEPMELDFTASPGSPEKPVAQRAKLPIPSPQIPTPPVCTFLCSLSLSVVTLAIGLARWLTRG
jgi:hypothetical protein